MVMMDCVSYNMVTVDMLTVDTMFLPSPTFVAKLEKDGFLAWKHNNVQFTNMHKGRFEYKCKLLFICLFYFL